MITNAEKLNNAQNLPISSKNSLFNILGKNQNVNCLELFCCFKNKYLLNFLKIFDWKNNWIATFKILNFNSVMNHFQKQSWCIVSMRTIWCRTKNCQPLFKFEFTNYFLYIFNSQCNTLMNPIIKKYKIALQVIKICNI